MFFNSLKYLIRNLEVNMHIFSFTIPFLNSVYIVLTWGDSLANKDDSEFNVSFYSNIHTLTLSFQGKIVQKENKADSFFTI